jgi:hypothetical protein
MYDDWLNEGEPEVAATCFASSAWGAVGVTCDHFGTSAGTTRRGTERKAWPKGGSIVPWISCSARCATYTGDPC